MKKRIVFVLTAAFIMCCLFGCSFTAVNDPVGISKDEAVSLAFEHFGVDGKECKSVFADEDHDSYDIEFICNGKEYEAEVDKKTGKVTEIDVDGGAPVKDTTADDTKSTSADTTPADTTVSAGITEEEAKAKALEYFNIKAEDASFLRVERDDGKYEIEFRSENIEYEIEIRVSDGTVIEADRDREDVWN